MKKKDQQLKYKNTIDLSLQRLKPGISLEQHRKIVDEQNKHIKAQQEQSE